MAVGEPGEGGEAEDQNQEGEELHVLEKFNRGQDQTTPSWDLEFA